MNISSNYRTILLRKRKNAKSLIVITKTMKILSLLINLK